MTDDSRPISVAELLARNAANAAEGAASATGRRGRRHRGGENSVTVAELTGEIPVVRAGGDATGDDADESTQAGQIADAAVEHADDAGHEVPVEAAGSRAAPVEAELLPAEETPEASEPEVVDAQVAEAHATETHATATEADTVEPEPGRPEPDGPGSGGPQQPHAWSQWGTGTPGMATADFSTATVHERAQRAPDTASFSLSSVAEARRRAETGAWPDEDAATPSDAGQTGAQPEHWVEEDDDYATTQLQTRDRGEFDVPGQHVDERDGKSGGRSRPGFGWLALLGEVVVGLLVGAVLFFGFFKLWGWGGVAPMIFTVVLAAVVIIAIVMFTHLLRRTTDLVTLGLALAVGIVITFGPLVMYLSTRSS
ncbi:hypothetical protein [Tsukamurella soli]|uniref:Uncharacterized protein n=1 Tax=Tsukamurella soli TaxID=644556 RepID=A0ABP8J4G3_9ACTN